MVNAENANALETLIESLLDSESLKVGLRELRDDGEVVYLADSRSTAELLGVTPEAMRGRTSSELLPGPAGAACKAMIADVVATNAPTTRAIEFDGRDLRCTVVPVAGDRPRQLVFVEEVKEGQEPVFAALVHELGNPLIAVIANLDHVLRALARGADRDDVLAALADARTAADHASDVLATMRALAYPREGAAALPLASLAHVPGARVVGDVPAVDVIAGRSAARQILANLIANATRANARAGAPGLPELRAREDDGHVVVTITDDGLGIDPAIASRLFTPFATASSGGTGLGLYISRALAERIGARVSLRDRDDGARGAVAELILRVRGTRET
jgi:hypothetical protein